MSAPPSNVVMHDFEVPGGLLAMRIYDTDVCRRIVMEVLQTGMPYPILSFIPPPENIWDVGAYIGDTAIHFAANYPKAMIHAFEPFDRSYAMLRFNTVNLKRVRCYPYGLSSVSGEWGMELGDLDNATNRTSITGRERIALRQASEVAEEIGRPDILKLDTEGSEVAILSDLGRDILSRTSIVYIEYHDARDRMRIDSMLCPSHTLTLGRICHPNRAELIYVRTDLLPEEFRRH